MLQEEAIQQTNLQLHGEVVVEDVADSPPGGEPRLAEEGYILAEEGYILAEEAEEEGDSLTP
jgi:hypothetical protein